MPKGRNKPTPMVMFMQEKREEMERTKGRKYKRGFDEDLYNDCKPLYDQLTESQKQFYKDWAKEEWTGIKQDKNKKLTSDGTPVAEIERREEEARRKKQLEFSMIEQRLKYDLKTILPMEFVIIHVNWFCVVNGSDFIPAEVALARFSLAEGLLDTYHCFPRTDEFPLGTLAESQIHSERTHQIPTRGFREHTTPLQNIYREIAKFLAKGQKSSPAPDSVYPLYTLKDDVNDVTSRKAVQSFLDSIVLAAHIGDDRYTNSPHEKYFSLFDLGKLLLEMKKKDLSIPSDVRSITNDIGLVESILRRDTFLQSPKTACEWHDDQDLVPKCSRTRVISWVYIICYHCKSFIREIIPGKHIPFESTIKYDYQPAPGVHVSLDDANSDTSYATGSVYGCESQFEGDNEFDDDTYSVSSLPASTKTLVDDLSNMSVQSPSQANSSYK